MQAVSIAQRQKAMIKQSPVRLTNTHRVVEFLARGAVTYESLVEHVRTQPVSSNPERARVQRETAVRAISKVRAQLNPGWELATWRNDNGVLMVELRASRRSHK